MIEIGRLFAETSTDVISNTINQVTPNGTNTDLSGIIGNIITVMLFIVGILAVVMIIFSGIRYVTAHGDKAQVESAKNTLIYSVVGLVIAIVAYALVNWVVSLFGGGSSGGSTGGTTRSGGATIQTDNSTGDATLQSDSTE